MLHLYRLHSITNAPITCHHKYTPYTVLQVYLLQSIIGIIFYYATSTCVIHDLINTHLTQPY